MISGWIATLFVILGFVFNAIGEKYLLVAYFFWILGDLIFIYYNICIGNYAHIPTNVFIIGINGYGTYKFYRKIKYEGKE